MVADGCKQMQWCSGPRTWRYFGKKRVSNDDGEENRVDVKQGHSHAVELSTSVPRCMHAHRAKDVHGSGLGEMPPPFTSQGHNISMECFGFGGSAVAVGLWVVEGAPSVPL